MVGKKKYNYHIYAYNMLQHEVVSQVASDNIVYDTCISSRNIEFIICL